jgi:putative lipoic acid-binding regulatory protein
MTDFNRQQFEVSLRLLEETHDFPCEFMFKVIGLADDQFVQRVVLTVRQLQQMDEDPPFRFRQTPSGRHIAVTLEPQVASAEEVMAIYREIRQIEGVIMLM